jgi:hypothetical protein
VKQPRPCTGVPGGASEGIGVAIGARPPRQRPSNAVGVAQTAVKYNHGLGHRRPALAGPPLVVPLNEVVAGGKDRLLQRGVRSRESLRFEDPRDPLIFRVHAPQGYPDRSYASRSAAGPVSSRIEELASDRGIVTQRHGSSRSSSRKATTTSPSELFIRADFRAKVPSLGPYGIDLKALELRWFCPGRGSQAGERLLELLQVSLRQPELYVVADHNRPSLPGGALFRSLTFGT